jgi:hypothetical protein
MEDLFREILAPSAPSSPIASSSLSLPLEAHTSPALFQVPSAPTTAAQMMMTTNEASRVNWESEAEMQRLLAMLPDIQSSFDDGTTTHGHVALEFDLESEWDFERPSTTMMGMGVDVF